ncbi:unnamed protein product [Penicillium camemberti]|uniref:Str. FM013 n=1 Tax=Penicillium camemberti (strain FM 013) TaxID=1429867 RepID=A0A0G4PU28_PENC3|nr:unnamed protein product [Penicillium camemberti]
MPKLPPPPHPFKNPVQTEEVYDLESEADNALAVNQIPKNIVWEDLEDLEDEELHSRRHSKKQASNEQREMLEEVTESIWASLETIYSTDLDSLRIPCVNTYEKQEAMRLAIENGKVNRTFLGNFILRTWEAIQDERKEDKKRQPPPPSDSLERKKNNKRRKSSPSNFLGAQKRHGFDPDTRKWMLQTQPSTGNTTTDLEPHRVTFSSLKTLADDLIEKLAQPDFEVHRFKFYQNEILCFGSLQNLKDRIGKCILPEVRQLEGQRITRQMLDDIHSLQDPLSKWPAIGGYLLYITSSEATSEAEEYWRPYVGQASLLIRRIPQHITEVLQGHIHTLCYWVASKPGRQLNFMRLWEIIEEEEEEDTYQSLELLNTLLEMIFCLGFQSLPLPTLNRFLGPQEFSLRGLNVVSPLLQNITLSPNERAECRQWLRFSPSLETQQFAETRAKELQQRQNLSLQPSSQRPNYEDIQREFRDQIIPYSCPFLTHKDEVTGKIPSNLRQPIDNTIIEKSVAVYLKEQGVEEYLQAFPFSSNEAPIRFILDFDIPSLKYNGENFPRAKLPHLAIQFPGSLCP